MIPTVPTGRKYTSHTLRAMSLLAACTCLVVLFVMMCGVAEAADYGTITVTTDNDDQWSTNLSNNVSNVTGNIIVNDGAALHLSNATIRMKNEPSINVESGATMNVTNGSIFTSDSGYYSFNYKINSSGNLSDSTVEYSNELNIQTINNITIDNCTIRNNQNHGIYLTSTSGYVNITDCMINNTVEQHGIFIESSKNNILRNNSLNNNSRDYSLYVTGDYDQDIDTTNTVNGGLVYYNYSDSGTITGENNIGHVTIANCSNLWFTGCTIHNGDGVRIIESSSNGISGSTIENNTGQGVYFADSSHNTINDSYILNNSKQGIYSTGSSSYNRIINNSVINNAGSGIYLSGIGNNNITDNNISENSGNGISIGSATEHPGDNIIQNNTILSNSGIGVTFYSNNNDLSENTISGDSNHTLQFMDPYYYKNYIWRNNTANGEEVNYYHNEQDIIIESKYLSASNVSNVGKITLIDCTNITIRDSEFSNNVKSGYGIFLWNSSNNNLTNNTLSNNYNGILLHASSNNNITDLQTTNPSNEYGAIFESFSGYNSIIDSSFAATNNYGLWITSSNHTTLINIMISSVNQSGLVTSGAHYIDITNATIVTTEADGAYLISSDHVTITESGITANNTGIHFTGSNHTDLINNTIGGEDGIYMSESHWGNLTNNIIDATLNGIFLTTSGNHNLTANKITNYTSIGILLEKYSTNTTMIGNDLTPNGSEFDIRINDSNGATFTNNESTAANYIFYLTNDTRLCTLDTVFDKTKVGYEDTSNLTLMWRIDVLCLDNFHQEPMWTNLTVRYRDIGDYNESLCWDGETPNANGRLSNNAFGDYGPPTSSSNWLPVIEYKQNASTKMIYQPMNCTAVNRWDVLNNIYGKSYKNITAAISGPGVTILVDAGHTPNGKCYYCHIDKLRYADGTFKFLNTTHWTEYNARIMNASLGDPYTPGRCTDCHNETDSIKFPHGNASGKDLLYQPSPQLCYNGKGNQTCHNSSVAVRATLNQKEEFNQTTHHPLGDGKLACKACHDNHGSKHRFDLLRYYTNSTSGGYNSDNYALCFVCHLEEKIVAKMSGEDDLHLQNYTNQTNFRDEYYNGPGFSSSNNLNIHSPRDEITHTQYNCYSCHNPHGSGNPATTRDEAAGGGPINYTYITNVSPTDNTDWEVLDYANWNNTTANKGGGLYLTEDGCACHYVDQWGDNGILSVDFFTYREFIDYKPAGGAGCLECHDNNASAYNETPIRPIVNLTAIKLAMHTNLSGAFRNGSILQGTTRTFNQWLENRTYTPAQINNITEDNAICWACHSTNGTPPYPGFHPDRALSPYKCPKCHGPEDGQPPHTQGLVAAIDNHGPTTKGIGSIFIQTDVGSNGSCEDCHAPSVLQDYRIDDPFNPDDDFEVWKYGTRQVDGSGTIQNFVKYTGRTTMGNVSHYGLNRSQGEALNIANPLLDTSDCLFCHCNSTNGAIWGNAPNVTDNMYGANTSNLSVCYDYCHVLPDYIYNVNEDNIPHFHNKSLYAGGGFDCVICHDIGSSYGVQSLVDADAIAAGIHGNVTNNTFPYFLEVDPRSKPCWGCHNSDGMQPEGMGDRNFIYQPHKKPWSCEDCHARSDEWNAETSYGETWISASYPPNRLPPIIYAHYPNSTTLETNMSHGRCLDCHNNSINQDHADTHGQKLNNTLASNISHYGTTTDLIYPTEDCSICHNTTTDNATKWGGTVQNQHGNFTNESDPDDGCYVCHTNDDKTPVDFHAANLWSGEGGFECLDCHDNDGFAKRKVINGSVYEGAIHTRMNNATTGLYGTNQSCWVCHFENGMNADKHSMLKDPPYLCHDCHNKAGGPFSNVSDAPEVHNHFKNGTNISAYWTRPTDSDSCMGCHNQSEMFYPFTENDTYRTAFSVVSHYGDNRTDIVDMFVENNNTAYCSYCHVNTSTPFMEFENDKNIRHAGSQNCSECHGDGRLHNETLTRAHTSGNCTDCHALYGVNKTSSVYVINVTAMNLGVHANLNDNMTPVASASPINDPNNSMCWGCHVPGGAYPETGHNETFNNDAYLCYECHNGTYAYLNVSNATAVYNHFKGGIDIKARTNAETNSTSCGYGCHNLSTMKVPGFDAGGNASYRVNMSQASHYARSRPDIANVNGGYSDCTWCHRDSTNEFIGIFEYPGPPNYTANITHATKTSGCIVPECHNIGRMHDLNLTIPTLNWSEECKSCHIGLEDSDAYVNETMFDASVHGDVNCTMCHINTQMNHPIEDYTWKWCECCHSYQADPINESDRHNVTTTPSTYSVGGKNVLDIEECTTCHNATAYNAAVGYYNSTYNCRYCHVYPDKGNRTSQEWY
jgi:parallel beta-helix repeat protein